ncbi:aluminum-activated malate transporter 9 isoform X2 [Cryptomeria japonica]|uniref:aluminum-activated malate transporter 9 isoform X2 n=1 Tax=Cryptomeria japonica TaxID=3369 RepID=UPI0027D9EDEE|nr:aluminum-activated malate transporter 9 isoform X2 [Cryptomeria japonica]
MPPNREVNNSGQEQSKESLLSREEKEKEYSDVEGQQARCGCCVGLREWVIKCWNGVCTAFSKALEFGKSDPRKVIFSVKMGMALSLVSLLMFMEEPYKQISTHSIWAILTVVVVFEFTVGATLSKGFNRGLGTLTAGGLAFGVAELAMYTEEWEPLIFIISIFTAGEDLHKLIVKNFMGVANSLEGCMDGYLSGLEIERVTSKILTFQADDDPVYKAYRSVIISASQEETLGGFASWEWPHGNYAMMKYPWKDYVKLGGALRHCTYMVMALHGCILSEIQAPRELRQIFSNELRQVSAKGANVLRALGNNLDKMMKLKSKDMLDEVHTAAEELQAKIDARSYLLVNSESWVIGNRGTTVPSQSDELIEDEGRDQLGNLSHQMSNSNHRPFANDHRVNVLSRSWHSHNSSFGLTSVTVAKSPEKKMSKQLSWPSPHSTDTDHPDSGTRERTLESASALSLATFASLLIEFVARLDNLVKSFNELSLKAKFKEPDSWPSTETNGICQRLLKIFRLRS